MSDSEDPAAFWYTPQNKGMAEKGLSPTLFDPQYREEDTDSGKSAEEIAREFQENVAATGMYLHDFTTTRLALHETLVSILLNFHIDDEDTLEAAFNDIYYHHVLPAIDTHRDELEQHKVTVRDNAEDAIAEFYNDDVSVNDIDQETYAQLQHIHSQFTAKLQQYSQETQELEEKRNQDRQYFSRADRQRLYELEKIITFMRENERAIVYDLLSKNLLNSVKTAFTHQLISGDNEAQTFSHLAPIIQREDIVKNYTSLPYKDADTRLSTIIAAGPASGKSKVVSNVIQHHGDRRFMPMNPDYFKNFLLSHDSLSEEEQILHGSLTHPESSKIFDDLAERWQALAEQGAAPDLLMDIARAGGWMRDVAGTGSTPIEIHAPVVPMEEALIRAYHRGEETGRYTDTSFTIDAHRGQIDINIKAMQGGNDMYFYDQDVAPETDPTDLPVIARYSAQDNRLVMDDFAGMMAYLDKADLNPDAWNADQLWRSSRMDSIAKGLVSHANVMALTLKDGQSNTLATMAQSRDGTPYFDLKDSAGLDALMGQDKARDLLKNLAHQGVALTGEAELHGPPLIAEIQRDNLQDTFAPKGNNNTNVDVEAYARLLEELAENGQRVAKTQPLAIYDIRSDEKAFTQSPRIITRNLDDNSVADDREYNPDDPDRKALQICIDPKVHANPKAREEVIDQLKENGFYDGPGVYMKATKDNADYPPTHDPEASGAELRYPDSNQTRIALQLEEQVEIPVQWGRYTVEPYGSIIVRERDLPRLRQALDTYKRTGDAGALLDDEGKARIDVYGTDPHFVEDNYNPLPCDYQHYHHYIQQLLDEGACLSNTNTPDQKYIAIQLREGQALPVATAQGDITRAEHPDWLAAPAEEAGALRQMLDNPENYSASLLAGQLRMLDTRTVERSYTQEPNAPQENVKPTATHEQQRKFG